MPVLIRRSSGTSRSMREGLLEAVREAPTDSILVIHSESEDYSAWGGLTSWYAKMKAIRGVVVDGAVRDIREIRRLGLPVFSRKRTPASGSGRLVVASIGKPIRIDSLTIRKGDLVVADSDGIAIVPKTKVEAVTNWILERKDAQKRLKRDLQRTS